MSTLDLADCSLSECSSDGCSAAPYDNSLQSIVDDFFKPALDAEQGHLAQTQALLEVHKHTGPLPKILIRRPSTDGGNCTDIEIEVKNIREERTENQPYIDGCRTGNQSDSKESENYRKIAAILGQAVETSGSIFSVSIGSAGMGGILAMGMGPACEMIELSDKEPSLVKESTESVETAKVKDAIEVKVTKEAKRHQGEILSKVVNQPKTSA